MVSQQAAPAYTALSNRRLLALPQLRTLDDATREAMSAVAAVFPFRVNQYVIDTLIDWERVPDDPIFKLTFPQPEMLDTSSRRRLLEAMGRRDAASTVRALAREIRLEHNPHPAGQLTRNLPELDGSRMPGVQHKYAETVLVFPSQGQTCHAYCAYCFRWAQFVGIPELKLSQREPERVARYVAAHPEVTSVLFTGGDPMIMRARALRSFVTPLLEIEHVQSIRFGTKSVAWWPHRFLSDPDADDLLRLFEEVVAAGKHVALMAHYSHPRELEPPPAREAVRRIRATGATVRSQAPLIRGVNDAAELWADMWRAQVRQGIVPYYLFLARDTGPRHCFEVPIARALDIFSSAYRQVSGLARTVRGPSMSTTLGKVRVNGTATIHGERVFVLEYLQARNPASVGRPFFATYDERATWFDELRPALGSAPSLFSAPKTSPGGRKLLPVYLDTTH